MKAATSLFAVLLILSSTSLAQTTPVQTAAPAQPAAPTQPTDQAQLPGQTQSTDQAQQTAPVQTAAPVQTSDQTQPTDQAQQTSVGGDASKAEAAKPAATEQEAAKPEAAIQTPTPSQSLAESPSSTEAASATADAAPTITSTPQLVPGAKLFLEPMDGFEQFLSDAFIKKKVPVVVVKEREQADFVMSGVARLKRPGIITGMVVTRHGGGTVSLKDARSGNQVFFEKFRRVDGGTSSDHVYQTWAEGCAKHLKKAMEKK
jgi:flagellar motor protein MotB